MQMTLRELAEVAELVGTMQADIEKVRSMLMRYGEALEGEKEEVVKMELGEEEEGVLLAWVEEGMPELVQAKELFEERRRKWWGW